MLLCRMKCVLVASIVQRRFTNQSVALWGITVWIWVLEAALSVICAQKASTVYQAILPRIVHVGTTACWEALQLLVQLENFLEIL